MWGLDEVLYKSPISDDLGLGHHHEELDPPNKIGEEGGDLDRREERVTQMKAQP